MSSVDREQQVENVRRWLDMLISGRQLSPAQRRIARFLVDYPEQAVYLTAEELGNRSGASQPSVTRFAAALGFSGYPELRESLRTHVQVQAAMPGDDAPMDSPLGRSFMADVANLRQLTNSPWAGERLGRVGGNLATSIPLPVVGLRVSRPLADLFGYFASKVHPDVRVIPAGSVGDDAIAGAAQAGAKWLLAFGLPRYPVELRASIRWARELGLRVALVTDSPLCPLANDVDDLLAAPVTSELTFDSPVAPLALTMALLQAITESLPAQAQRRLEEFDERAAQRGLFIT